MIASMTGYGKAVAAHNGRRFEVEAKSLNGRYLEVSPKLPDALRRIEFDVRDLAKKRFKRGKLFVQLTARDESVGNLPSLFDEETLDRTVAALRELKERAGVEGPITLDHVLATREFFETADDEPDEEMIRAVMSAVDEAFGKLAEMREKEGAALEKDLLERCAVILERVAEIEKAYEGSVEERYEKLRERMAELSADALKHNDRLETELALLADKADVSEECVRLKSHVEQFRDAIEAGGDAGRRLNFLCQEMHREANTIASKSISTEAVRLAVDVKEEIERIREQAQNVE